MNYSIFGVVLTSGLCAAMFLGVAQKLRVYHTTINNPWFLPAVRRSTRGFFLLRTVNSVQMLKLLTKEP